MKRYWAHRDFPDIDESNWITETLCDEGDYQSSGTTVIRKNGDELWQFHKPTFGREIVIGKYRKKVSK
jgi:hypothetical protein